MKKLILKSPLLLVLALVLAALMALAPGAFAEETAEASPIIEQPKDTTVEIPEAARFEVKVDHPENYTYQWQYFQAMDKCWQDYIGEGSKVPVLEFSATERTIEGRSVRCIITNKDDPEKVYESEKATLTLSNVDEIKSYVIAAGQGIAPGQTQNFGGGKMSLSEDGATITLENVDLMQQEVPLQEGNLQGCLYYANIEENPKPLTIEVIGENTMATNYSDSVGNGINTMLYFSASDMPDVTVTGDTLILKGGQIGFNAGGRTEGRNCNFILDADMELSSAVGEWSTGVECQDFTLKTGKILKIERTNGGLSAGGNVLLEPDSSLIANLTPKGDESNIGQCTAVRSQENFTMDRAAMEISVNIKKKSNLAPVTALQIGSEEGQGHLNATQSDFRICVTSDPLEEGDDISAADISGISSISKTGEDLLDNTRADIQVDAPIASNALACSSKSNISLKNGAKLTAYVKSKGDIIGVSAYNNLNIDDATIITSIAPMDKNTFAYALGAQYAKVNLTNPDYRVEASASEGMAMGEYLRDSETAVGYDPTYKAERIVLTGKAVYLTPADTVVSTGSLLARSADENNEDLYQVFETPYSKGDTSALAKIVTIGVEKPGPTPTPSPVPSPTPQPSVNGGPVTGLQENGPNSAAIMAAGLCAAVVIVVVAYGIKSKKR